MVTITIILGIIIFITSGCVFFLDVTSREKKDNELTDNYRDDELNSVFDDYGENKFDF